MAIETAQLSPLLSLADVAARSTSRAGFRRNLRALVKTLRAHGSRSGVTSVIAGVPDVLAGRFTGGDIADAELAACAREIARRARIDIPAWASSPARGTSDAAANASVAPLLALMVDSIRLRAGRPVLSREHKRRTNAQRQRRFRLRRAAEWKRLQLIHRASSTKAVVAKPPAADITLDLHPLP